MLIPHGVGITRLYSTEGNPTDTSMIGEGSPRPAGSIPRTDRCSSIFAAGYGRVTVVL